jgi:hypothetical protein
MMEGKIIHRILKTAGLITVLVIMQQLIMSSIFRLAFDWSALPLLICANFGIVAGWFHFRKTGIKIPAFVVFIASFCYVIWLRAAIIYLEISRMVAAFITPQFAAAFAAAILLLLILPNARKVYRVFLTNGFLMSPRSF